MSTVSEEKKIMYMWLIILSGICTHYAWAQTDPAQSISIGILYEAEQDDVPAMMTTELRNLERAFPTVSLNDLYVTMDRENINGTLDNRNFPANK